MNKGVLNDHLISDCLLMHTVIYIYITLFHQLNGSIKICKKYINKYNATKKERKEKNKNLG